MDYNKQHPLSQITGGSSLSMLEMLIPYVDFPFKLPLALFIKFNEIRIIINALQNMDMIEHFGLHNANNSPIDMLASVTGISPDMLQMLMSMTENGIPGMNPDFPFGTQNPFQAFGMGGFPPPPDQAQSFETPPPGPAPSPASESFPPQPDITGFDDRINELFSEYDNQIIKENINGF